MRIQPSMKTRSAHNSASILGPAHLTACHDVSCRGKGVEIDRKLMPSYATKKNVFGKSTMPTAG